MDKEILLSICIPVYNGGEFLRFNLKTIFEQLRTIDKSMVEVIVSDNCSTDNTMEILAEFKEKYPKFLTYSQNDQNNGSDYNILKLIKLAHGKFIHLMGADDWYEKKGIQRIIDTLKKHPNLSVLLLGNFFYRQSVAEYCNRANLNLNYYQQDEQYDNKDEFFLAQEDRIWPLTNLVLNRSLLIQCKYLDLYIRKDWMHIFFVLWNLHLNPNSIILSDKQAVVINRVDVQTWMNKTDGPRIYLNHLKVVSSMKQLGFQTATLNKYVHWFLINRSMNMKFTHPCGFINKLKYAYKYFKIAYSIPYFYKFVIKFIF